MNNEPVAYAMFKESIFMDAIHPDEHKRFEGGYNIPLYTHPVKELTDEEIKDFLATFPIIFTVDDLCTFARAILRKAHEK